MAAGALILVAALMVPMIVPAGASATATSQQLQGPSCTQCDGFSFGWSVATAGDTAVVGDPGLDSGNGAALVFHKEHGSWTQVAELTAPDAAVNETFGKSVAIAGGTIVVGDPQRANVVGAAFVYTEVQGSWTQQADLTASDGESGDGFGNSVAISGRTIVVGAPGRDSQAGIVYVFGQAQGSWAQHDELQASDGAANHEFGYPVAISNNTIVVAAPEIDVGLGRAYVFTRHGKSWIQQAELSEAPAADGGEFPGFGWSVGVSGHTVVVGMPGGDPNGVAYVFTGRDGVWSEQAELLASDGSLGDGFGDAVSVTDDEVLIGAPGHTALAGGAGAAYLFNRVGGTWTQGQEFGGESGDSFGWSVALSNHAVVVGAVGAASGAGGAYSYPLGRHS